VAVRGVTRYFLGVNCPEIHDECQEARKKASSILQEWNTKMFDVEEEEKDGSGG